MRANFVLNTGGAFAAQGRRAMLHIGSGYIVHANQVVLICDLESVDARACLSRMKKSARITRIDAGDKSLVLCSGRWGEACYLSPIAARTLARRFEAIRR
jgi:regulator of extracellular matrix RemA (YlzA/DUF370 family)